MKVRDRAKMVYGTDFLGHMKFDDHYTLLYAIENFYVEVCYCVWTDQIIGVHSFADSVRLTPYLEAITIRNSFS
ncbi:hypothetical protein [Mucilaginibacter sp. HD30]